MGSDSSKLSPQALSLKSLYPQPFFGYGYVREQGPSYGDVYISNSCPYTVYIRSVGARTLGGPRSNITGTEDFGTPFDNDMYEIKHGGWYMEPFRVTCPRKNKTHEYCPDEDKAAGQGVSFKISRTQELKADHTQFEYALLQNTTGGDTFMRLRYDISLLDCGRVDGVKDADATDEQHKDKVAKCPGYDGGIAVSFDNDTDTVKCQPIFCDGEHKCNSINTWDWTPRDEANLEQRSQRSVTSRI